MTILSFGIAIFLDMILNLTTNVTFFCEYYIKNGIIK